MGDEMTVLRDGQDKLEGRVAASERTVERETGLRARAAALRAKMDEDPGDVTETLLAAPPDWQRIANVCSSANPPALSHWHLFADAD